MTGANRHDVTQLLPLVNGFPAIGGNPGRPIRRPESLYADPAYHSEMHSILLRHKGIRPHIAQRGQPHGSGLGKVRWVVERTLSWLHQYRRRRIPKHVLSTSELQDAALALYRGAGYALIREEIAQASSNKMVGGGVCRYYFEKTL